MMFQFPFMCDEDAGLAHASCSNTSHISARCYPLIRCGSRSSIESSVFLCC